MFRLFRWQWMALSRLGAVALVLYLGYEAWDYFGPHKPEIGPVRREAVDQVIPTIVEDMRASRHGVRAAAILHFTNDPSDYVTNRLRSAIEQSGILNLRDRTVGEKVWDALRLEHKGYGDIQAAVARGKSLGTDAVVYGSVHTLESSPGGVTLDIEVGLADVASGQSVFSKKYSRESALSAVSPAVIQEQTHMLSWPARLIAWAVAILLLPVFTIGFIRTMVKKESNRANAFVLGIYTFAAALLAYLIVGVDFGSWLAILLFLIAVGAALAYNVFIMTFALKLET
jgi:hypothetical protein